MWATCINTNYYVNLIHYLIEKIPNGLTFVIFLGHFKILGLYFLCIEVLVGVLVLLEILKAVGSQLVLWYDDFG